MSDRASTSCTIYHCPDDKRAEVLELIREYFAHIDWCEAIGDDLAEGVNYTEEELSVGLDDSVANELLALGCTGEVHQDAKYEFDAMIHMFAPDLGMYVATSTQDGAVVLTSDEIEEAIGLARQSRSDEPFDELVDELRRRTGKIWRNRFTEIQTGWAHAVSQP